MERRLPGGDERGCAARRVWARATDRFGHAEPFENIKVAPPECQQRPVERSEPLCPAPAPAAAASSSSSSATRSAAAANAGAVAGAGGTRRGERPLEGGAHARVAPRAPLRQRGALPRVVRQSLRRRRARALARRGMLGGRSGGREGRFK